MIPSAEMKARLLEAVKVAPSMTRAARRRLAISLFLAVAGLVAVELVRFHVGLRPGARPWPFIVATSLAWLLSIGALVAALRSRAQLGLPVSALWALSLGSLAFPYIVGLIGNLIDPQTAIADPEHPGRFCLDLSLAVGTVPLSAYVFLRRDSDPVHPVALGAMIGAFAGSMSGLVVNLTCVYSDPMHIAVGHLLPAALQVGVGALMGKWVISLRHRQSPRRVAAALGGTLGAWCAIAAQVNFQRSCPLSYTLQQRVELAVGIVAGVLVGIVVHALWARRASAKTMGPD